MTKSFSSGHDDLTAEPRSVELRDYALVIRRRWVLIAVVAVLGAVLAMAYSVHKGRTYAATSEVVVQPTTQGPLNPPAQPNLQVNMITEQAVAESAPVAALASQDMPASVSAAVAQGRLASHLTVTVPLQSNVLQLTWRAGSPQAAQQGANAFADGYLEYRHTSLAGQASSIAKTLAKQVASLQAEIKSSSAQLNDLPVGSAPRQTLSAGITALNGRLTGTTNTLASLATYDTSGGNVIRAGRPLSPVGLSRSVIAVLGALLGLLAGIVIAFVRDSLDDRLRDPAVLERELGVPTLAVQSGSRGVPGISSERRRRSHGHLVATIADPDGAGADSFRALRGLLTSVPADAALPCLVVIGVDGHVPSSEVAAELGVALAESGRRTVLIAADIRGSSLARIFGLSDEAGLADILSGKVDSAAVIQHPTTAGGIVLPHAVAQRLTVIPAGPLLGPPLSLLDSVAMVTLLDDLRASHDFVVMDSPPADAVSDALALARLADGVVAVAAEVQSKGQAAVDLRLRLDRTGGRLAVGVLLMRNRGRRRRPPSRGLEVPGDRPNAEPGTTSAEQPHVIRSAPTQPKPGSAAGAEMPPDADSAPASETEPLARRPS
jgi:Mrp family chromosome partitioning ATPase/capsular polysaccharide biosynthesis protein